MTMYFLPKETHHYNSSHQTVSISKYGASTYTVSNFCVSMIRPDSVLEMLSLPGGLRAVTSGRLRISGELPLNEYPKDIYESFVGFQKNASGFGARVHTNFDVSDF